MTDPGSGEGPDGGPTQLAVSSSPSWPYFLVGLAVLGVGVAAWSPIPAGVWHDDGVYMLVGKAIAAGHGLTYDGVVGAPPAAKFPPLYPALLALLWLVFRGIGAVTLAATTVNLVFVAVAAALFAKALADNSGLSVRLGATVAVLAYVSTDLLRTALVPLSESLFLVLTAAAFALWAGAAERRGRAARVGLAVVLASAVATRSAGLALVVAFGVALWRSRGPRDALAVTAPAIAAAGLWSWWSGVRSQEIPEGLRDLLGPYGAWLIEQTLSAPAAFVAGLPSHALGLVERITVLLVPGPVGWWLPVLAVPAGGFAVFGFLRAVRLFPPLAWALPAYGLMLLLWPYLDRRLVVPLHPLILAAVAMGGAAAYERLADPRSRGVLLGVGGLWLAAYSVVTAGRIANDWPVAPYRLRADRLAAAVEALDRTAPDDAVVGAPEYWAALHLHGGWTVSPSVRFDPRRADPQGPMWGTPEELIRLWRASGIDHLLLEQGGALHGGALDVLEAECPGRVSVLARSDPQLVVRIAWDRPCDGSDDRPPEP